MNWRGGFKRIGIVAAVLWFAYWAYQCYDSYTAWMLIDEPARKTPLPVLVGASERARDVFYGNLLAAFLLPALAFGAFLLARWIVQGFRAPR